MVRPWDMVLVFCTILEIGGGALSRRLPCENILEALTLLLIKIIPSIYIVSFHIEPSITLVSISYVPNACKTVCLVPSGM